EAKVNEDKICKEGDFIIFDNVEGEILLESLTEESLFLVLSGEPINEPVVSHGPFVMNTLGEILDAYEDFRNNKFGTENF
ncbi:MAG: pirin-like C-terminal cupin domain-containing protein, partial [Clostridium perfringens]|nr:pirin-like C-terminal cupin domain-containing protein [Clostridium perfringens]